MLSPSVTSGGTRRSLGLCNKEQLLQVNGRVPVAIDDQFTVFTMVGTLAQTEAIFDRAAPGTLL